MYVGNIFVSVACFTPMSMHTQTLHVSNMNPDEWLTVDLGKKMKQIP